MKLTPRFPALSSLPLEWRDLALLLYVALGLRLLWAALFILSVSAIEADGAHYARIAENLLRGRGYVGNITEPTGIFTPPLFPALIVAASDLTPSSLSLESAARLVSVPLGTLLVVPTYLLALAAYGRKPAAIAGLAVAAHPLLGRLSGMVLIETTYLTLLFAASYCAVRSMASPSRQLVCLAGALFGLACLTSLAAAPCAFLVAIIYAASDESIRKGLGRSALFLGTLTITVAPAAAVLAVASEVWEFQILPPAVPSVRPSDGVAALWAFGSPVLFAFAALGWFRRRSTDNASAHLVLTSLLIGHLLVLGTISAPVSFLVVMLPVLLIWAGNGAYVLGEWLATNRHYWPAVATPAVALSVVLLISSRNLDALAYVAESDPSRTRLVKQVGEWVSRVDVDDARLMDTSPDLAFHAGASFVPLPNMSSEALLNHIDEQQPDFIVVRDTLSRDRPHLQHWVDEGIPDRRALLIYGRKPIGTGQQILVYRWRRDGENPNLATGTYPPENRPIHGPLRVNPANTRYFADATGRSVYLTGAHTWSNLQDADRFEPPVAFDFGRYLSLLQSHRLNFVRLWAWEHADWVNFRPYHFRFSPLPFARVGPGVALDDKPKFDINKFNDEYFRRLRNRVSEAQKRGIYVSVMLFQGFSVHRPYRDEWGHPWQGHPFNKDNNVNGIDGDPEGTRQASALHTLGDARMLAAQEAYVERVVDAVNEFDNVLYEICNECRPSSMEWQYHMIRFVHELESRRPKQHPVGMTAYWGPSDNEDLFGGPADWISPYKGGYDSNPPAARGEKVIIIDTDHLWGIGGTRAWVWKSFLRGLNPIFMDPYDHEWMLPQGDYPPVFAGDAQWHQVRLNMGHTAAFAARIDLTTMVPRGDLSSSTFCLARTEGPNPEYLTYNPVRGRITLDLTESSGLMQVAWFEPETAKHEAGGTTTGGAVRTFTSPFDGDAVLHLYSTR